MEQRSEQTDEIVRRDRVTVSAVIATYNEEGYIGDCLTGLLAQCGIDGELEILVIDGMSRDRTADIVRSFPEFGSTIRLLSNPRRLQVFAWNVALREMRGEYFAMLTAHAEYAPDYLAKCMATIGRTGAVAVGGVPRAYAHGRIGRAIAWCMSTPFGVGGARFRYLDREEECDTVPLIFARRADIERTGGWDETIAFDEDSELSYRLRRAGGKLIVSPAIGVRYYVRESFRALWKQMFRYGYWRRYTQLKHPDRVPLRVLAPPLLLASVALSALLLTTPARIAAAIVPLLYGGFLAVAAALSARTAAANAFLVPAALVTMHAAYGAGYWNALVKSLLEPRGKRTHTFAR